MEWAKARNCREVTGIEDLASRSAREVFDDHLDLAQQGRFGDDITRQFSQICVVLTNHPAFRGHTECGNW